MINKPPALLATPDNLPQTEEEAKRLQEANQAFWEQNPMRYDWTEAVGHGEFTKPFFDEIDRRFFENVRLYMPWKKTPFDELIPFEELADARVLEIGVGNGSHAQLLAAHCKDFIGIDLTEYAKNSTTARLKVWGLQGAVVQMDAESLQFPDNHFDFVWSWGVIHHSSNTSKIIGEIRRVLKPGGKTCVMVYHKGWWNYYFLGFFVFGLLQGRLFKNGSLHKTVQEVTDGALARYYSSTAWRKMIGNRLKINKIEVKGSKAEVFPLPGGRLKSVLVNMTPNWATRFMTNRLKMGSFLICHMEKKG